MVWAKERRSYQWSSVMTNKWHLFEYDLPVFLRCCGALNQVITVDCTWHCDLRQARRDELQDCHLGCCILHGHSICTARRDLIVQVTRVDIAGCQVRYLWILELFKQPLDSTIEWHQRHHISATYLETCDGIRTIMLWSTFISASSLKCVTSGFSQAGLCLLNFWLTYTHRQGELLVKGKWYYPVLTATYSAFTIAKHYRRLTWTELEVRDTPLDLLVLWIIEMPIHNLQP